MKFSQIGVLAILLLAAEASFGVTVNNTDINVIMIDRTNGAKIYLKTSVTRQVNNPACHTNTGWAFVLPLATETEKAIYSALLAAKNAGRKVNLVGSAECSTHSGIETLNRVEVL